MVLHGGTAVVVPYPDGETATKSLDAMNIHDADIAEGPFFADLDIPIEVTKHGAACHQSGFVSIKAGGIPIANVDVPAGHDIDDVAVQIWESESGREMQGREWKGKL